MTNLAILFAGPVTVTISLNIGLLLLMKHQDVQAKVHEEIDRVIGRNRQPKFEDRLKMPYTEAVIHEIKRVADIVPMGMPHRVTKDTRFQGFLLPKDTEVFPLLGSVLKDPKFFSNPEEFNPQHFLDDEGMFKRRETFVPFSLGKRACLGDTVASMELFLFLTTIMQNFHVQTPQDFCTSQTFGGYMKAFAVYTMGFVAR